MPNFNIKTNPSFDLGGGLNLTGGLALNGGLLNNIGVSINNLPNPLPVISLDVAVSKLPKIITESTVGVSVAITDLPKIRLEFGFKPTRVHLPTHYQMCFSVFGKEVFKFALCGETMVAIEPYLPHQTEKCA